MGIAGTATSVNSSIMSVPVQHFYYNSVHTTFIAMQLD